MVCALPVGNEKKGGDGPLQPWDIAIVGAGAAGMAAAVFAGGALGGAGGRVLLLDGARRPGAKILVSGGGRCNITNQRVAPEDYCGGPRNAVRNVLRAFDERRTLDWMRSLGVEPVLEPTGKYFPSTGKARTVLDALLGGVARAGVEFRYPARVAFVDPPDAPGGVFRLRLREEAEPILTRRVVLAAGGMALPKSGSDGWGFEAARRLGHTVVPATPALAPLVMDPSAEGIAGRFAEFSGLAVDARLRLVDAATGKRLAERPGAMLFTHFGISGPAPMDLSRHWLRARLEHPERPVAVEAALGGFDDEAAASRWIAEQAAAHPHRTLAKALAAVVPERLARAIAPDEAATLAHLPKAERARAARLLARYPLPVVGDRGYAFAETSSGGVPLEEVDHRTMESRRVPSLYFCGELLDVDGRIGGFNFQWAWATGFLAGRAAAASLADRPAPT